MLPPLTNKATIVHGETPISERTNATFLSNLQPFQAPLHWHAQQFATIGLILTTLNIPIARKLFTAVFRNVPGTHYREKYAPGWFKPLSIKAWAAHLATMPWGMELTSHFIRMHRYTTATQDASDGNETNDPKNKTWLSRLMPSTTHSYRTLGMLFAVSQLQALFALMAHAMINVNPTLEVSVMVAESILMRLHVFGAGLALMFGWWTMIPVAGLLLTDRLFFDNVPGIILSTFSMVVILCLRGLPVAFKTGWSLLGFLPIIYLDSSNDDGHTLGASLLSIPLSIMCAGLSAYARRTTRQPTNESTTQGSGNDSFPAALAKLLKS